MGCEIEDVWSEPEEHPRLRARREQVVSASRRMRLRKVGLGLMLLGAIVVLGSAGGLVGTFVFWLFGAWFGSQ
jgi:hypothetical protein